MCVCVCRRLRRQLEEARAEREKMVAELQGVRREMKSLRESRSSQQALER